MDSPPLRSYCPNAEDIRLWRVLSDVERGFYVDIGAGDPTDGSVTRLFYDRGWAGVNVEPGPKFERLAGERPRDVNLNIAIGETDEPVELSITYPDPHLSTTQPDVLNPAYVDRVEVRTVQQRRLDGVLAEHASDRTIDFLKVDVEGSERAVLASCDWRRFRPRIVVVEAVRPWSRTPTHGEWEELLMSAAYVPAVFDGINRYYVDDPSLVAELSYPVTPLDNFVTCEEGRAMEATDALRAEVASLREELATLQSSRAYRWSRRLRRLITRTR